MQTASSIHTIGSPFIELQLVDSTNNYAFAQAHAGLALSGTVFFAKEQTRGKGQREKIWNSEKGANIILSILMNPKDLKIHQQFHLSACIAVSVYNFFSKYTGDETKIKWPNDIYWRDRKTGGILIENSISSSGKWQWAVIGIGININQTKFAENIANPVSLKQITGKTFDPVALAKELCLFIDEGYKKLLKDGLQPILDIYNMGLYKKNQMVKFKKENRLFEACVKEVSSTGQLITFHAAEERFDFGEVEWIIGS